ncbi:MAG: hypothetical protein GWP05_03235 [Anaerolineaceae bacterium]|nr:hypothetical protein [Anaerolineaceae bacterium]
MNRRSGWLAILMVVAALVITVGSGGCSTSPPEENGKAEQAPSRFADLDKLLPSVAALPGWSTSGKAIHYANVNTAATDPDLEDLATSDLGSGDTALLGECGYKMSVVQKLKQDTPPQTMTVSIHEMTDSDAAFSAFTLMASGQPLAGRWLQARAGGSAVAFVKGRYFVTVDHDGASGSKAEAVATLVASNIFSSVLKPMLVRDLPSENLVEGSEIYVAGPLGLQRAGRRLKLPGADLLTEALGQGRMVLATYTSGDQQNNTVFAIQYLSGARAAAARLDELLSAASSPDQLNSLAFTTVNDTHLVGSLTPEAESVQPVLGQLISNLGG